jgi:hypothetical protein
MLKCTSFITLVKSDVLTQTGQLQLKHDLRRVLVSKL